MLNFKNTYFPAADLKAGDRFRLNGGAVLIADKVEALPSGDVRVEWHSFDMRMDGAKTEGVADLPAGRRVRTAPFI